MQRRIRESMRLTSTVNSVEFENNFINEQMLGHSMHGTKAHINYKEQFKGMSMYQQRSRPTRNPAPNMAVQFSSKPLSTY